MALTAMPPAAASTTPRLAVWVASGSTVAFVPRNGQPAGEATPEPATLPRLVLRRNGQLTSVGERTILADLAGLEVPAPGVTVTLELETFHGDPDRGGGPSRRIVVWRESRWVARPEGAGPGVTAVQFRHEFGPELEFGPESGISTPTDYFRLEVTVLGPGGPDRQPLYTLSEDFALLLENEWLVALPAVLEEGEGAAPDEMLIYYSDMFPARRAGPGSESWLKRHEVNAYVENEFVPAALDAYRLQANGWRFPWHLAWTAHGSVGGPKQLAVALAPPDTWYHGQAPGNGHAGISINVDAVGLGYATLLDGMMSTFNHELFHNLQRGLYQDHGLAREGVWDMVTEGMAMLASSVAQPEVQFGESSGRRAYMASASAYLGEERLVAGDLNTSYGDISYNGAAYWRFLYEQCAVSNRGVEDPAAGMEVIRRVLAALYAREAAQELTPDGFVRAFPGIIDEALQGSSCPVQSHEETLTAFARAVYALRLEGGRCTGETLGREGCGFYDPSGLYPRPPADTVRFAGHTLTVSSAQQSYPAGIPSSYGIDLVEVVLEGAAHGQSLTVELHGSPAGSAEFRLEVWQVMAAGRRLLPAALAPEAAVSRPDGSLSFSLPELDLARYNRLGLIITRVDGGERLDPVGSYTLVLRGTE